MQKAPEYKLFDYVEVISGFFEGHMGVLVNIDYDGGSFRIEFEDDGTSSEEYYFVYADEIKLIESAEERGE